MELMIKHEPFECKYFIPFTPKFEHIFTTAIEFKENTDQSFTQKNVLWELAHDWDGEIAMFKKEDQSYILEKLEHWFKDELNHQDTDDDSGIVNCILIKETPNYLVLIDTQRDMGSTLENFYADIEKERPGIEIVLHSDCHLIGNLNLSRDSDVESCERLTLMYKEGVIDESFFFNAIVNLKERFEEVFLPKDRPIVLTGKMAISRDFLVKNLEAVGLTVLDTVKPGCWLWTGASVGEVKIKKAQSIGVECTPIGEVVLQGATDFLSFLKMKNKINDHVRMKCGP